MEFVNYGFEKFSVNKIWCFRIFIDKEGGINLEDCQNVSHLVGDLIEVEDIIESVYTLEVSSPGLNRVLKKEKAFIKFIGKKICVLCHAPLNGKKKFIGNLTGFKEQAIHLEVDGQPHTIPLNRVAKANLVVEI